MTFEALGEMFEGDFADTCAKTILLLSMGGRGPSVGSRVRTPGSEDQHQQKFVH